MQWFDDQVSRVLPRLDPEIIIPEQFQACVYSTILEEVYHLSNSLRKEIVDSSPVPIRSRLDTIEKSVAANAMLKSDLISVTSWSKTIIQNYTYFVFCADTIFRSLASHSDVGSISRTLGCYLRRTEYRHLRNSIAHGHWMISSESLIYWNKKNNRFNKYEVSEQELFDLWTLSRAVAYGALTGAQQMPEAID
ncbi:MAG: hypothetical protein ACK4Z0_04065 [Sphingomonadaceae bacterium]